MFIKKPHYPQWVMLAVLFICVAYLLAATASLTSLFTGSIHEVVLTGSVNASYIALAIGMLSALFVLREKESLYLIVFVSCMHLFFEFMIGLRLAVFTEMTIVLYGVLLAVHVGVLAQLSYMCFGALVGGGNYHETEESHHKKKKK